MKGKAAEGREGVECANAVLFLFFFLIVIFDLRLCYVGLGPT